MVGGQVEGESIRSRLVIRQVEVVRVPSLESATYGPYRLGAGDHGVSRVYGGALGAVDGAGVPELYVVPDVFGRQPEPLAEPASMMTARARGRAPLRSTPSNPAVPVLHPRPVAAAK